MEEKRIRVRAIIIHDGKLVSMYREKGNRIFYTFPGGGMEGKESEEDCVKREVLEEFGIIVKPIKKVYTYENQSSIEHFYLVEWISGKFGSGVGEEFDKEQTNGVYKPLMIDIVNIPNLPLMPREVATTFYEDYIRNHNELRSNVKIFLGEIK